VEGLRQYAAQQDKHKRDDQQQLRDPLLHEYSPFASFVQGNFGKNIVA
jgi:hypothetical protein